MATSEWKVLCVDDEVEFHQQLERVLASRMGEHRFSFTCRSDFSEAIDLIRDSKFDLIILDVNERGSDPDPNLEPDAEDQKGEELLRILKDSVFVPVVFYTGWPAKVEHLKSPVVQVVDKGASNEEIRSAVKSILSTGLPLLAKYIEEQSRAYLWENLEDVLKGMSSEKVTSDIALLTARNLSKNLSQKSIKELLGSNAELINPLEMYLFPPEKGSCNPADIFRRKEDGTLWMVLTPACDFEQSKAENVLLAQVTPLVEHELYKNWQEKARERGKLSPGQPVKEVEQCVKRARGDVIGLVKNNKGGRLRFLPGTFFLPDCIVDFQKLLNLPVNDANQYEILCSLDNPYREEILQLFSNYYGRIGTPDYEFDSIWEKIDQAFTP